MTASSRAALPQQKWKSEPTSVDDLLLDDENPRLRAAGLSEGASQDEILRALWEQMAVDEVAMSIAQNGFFQHEPLYAVREKGKLKVIEGNRRLAAVKLLRSAELRQLVGATDLPSVTAKDQAALAMLPVITAERSDLWVFVGFKHINGAQAWQSYSKAHYIAWVKNELGKSLEDIAARIGDTHQTVGRLYDGLMVLTQAEKSGQYTTEDRWKNHLSFSHLYTGLSYSGIREFIGLPPEERILGKESPVPKAHEKNLGELMVWLFGSKKQNRPPIVQSQNPDLRRLDQVLQNGSGVIALRKGLGLDVSLEIARGDDEVFQEALVVAKQGLQKARGTVVTGYKGNLDHLNTAKEIVELASALLEDMQQKAGAKKSQNRSRS